MTLVTTRASAFAKLWLLSFVVGIALLVAGHASADGRPFSRIVVFGDSLSDSGNLFALGELFPQFIDRPGEPATNWSMNEGSELATLVPGQAYVSGRLSNGRTWVELLGTALGLSANVRAVLAPDADLEAFNFAVAGATGVDRSIPLPLFHLGAQVNAFLPRIGEAGTAAETLYVIAIGGNDVRAAVELAPADAVTLLGQTLGAVEQAIRDVHREGGRKFLIWNIPDLGAAPAFQRLKNGVPELGLPPNPLVAEFATSLIAGPLTGKPAQRNGGYNAALKARLHTLSTELSHVEFIYFDAFKELTEVRQHRGRYGLNNVSDPCIQVQPFFPEAGTCARPDRNLFWDGIHPTRAMHAIIAFLNGKALVEALDD